MQKYIENAGRLIFIFISILLFNTLYARQTNKPLTDVKGNIVNERGEPVIATIAVKGTKIAVSSDSSGNFILKKISGDAILLISGVSIVTTEKSIGSQPAFLIIHVKSVVAENKEVIVEANTGYYTAKPNEINGAVTVIDNKTLNQQVGTNILKRLEGVSSGVLFDNNKVINGQIKNDNITIRGLSTINASTAVLIVIDGFIYEGDINNINPNDVESVTILKDAAAASIWGARAGNGVVVITTKKGKLNQKPQLTLNINTIVNEKPYLYYLPQMTSGDYINVEQYLFRQGYFDGVVGYPYQYTTPAVDVFYKRQMGLVSESDSAKEINSLKTIDTRRQYNKYVYRNATTQQYALNVLGGNVNNSYTFSVAYDKNLGELQDKSGKLNIRINNTYRPFKDFQININVYYTNSKTVSGIPAYGSITIGGRHVPYISVADAKGKPLPVATLYSNAYTDTAGGGKLLNWKYYPLDDYKHENATINQEELYANVGIQYKFLKYFGVSAQYQYQKQQAATKDLSDVESFNARNTINLFSQLDPNTGVMTYAVPVGGILNTYNTTVKSSTLRGQLDFNDTWRDHKISAILGSEMREAQTFSESNIVYGYNSDPLVYSNVDFVNYYPTYIDGSYQQISPNLAFANITNRFISFYGNASYIFKRKYTFSASGRRDGSNVFGVNTNDKWKPLWSAGLGWDVSQENFYKLRTIPYLKTRITYGYSGNVDLSKSAVAVGRYIGPAAQTNFPYDRITAINNPDLRWEKIGMLNMGIDFEAKNGILTGSIDYYHKKGIDLYGSTPYDYTTFGFAQTIIKNVASIKGDGFDVILNSRNIDRIFKWNSTILFSYNNNKTVSYETDQATKITSLIGNGSGIVPVIGRPLYAIAAYRWGGLDSAGNPQGYVNGQKSTDYSAIFSEAAVKGVNGNVAYIGPSSPTVFGSIINTLSWKSISLSFNIAYKFGYYFQKTSISYGALINAGAGNKDYEKRWQKPGDEKTTNVPSFIYPNDDNRDIFYLSSAINVLKADQIRLQYINLSYAFTQAKKTLWRNVRIYFNASNLGILWSANKENIDPDFPYSVPGEKAFAIGLTTNF